MFCKTDLIILLKVSDSLMDVQDFLILSLMSNSVTYEDIDNLVILSVFLK